MADSKQRIDLVELDSKFQSLRPGLVVDQRYKLLSKLGQGGMCAVFRAMDLDLNRDVAVKLLLPRLSCSPAGVKRFRREMVAVSSLSHPNIVRSYGAGQWEGLPYLVMELLEGETLAQLLAREKRLDDAKALPIFLQIADGLMHAHAAGVIHRDLKPSNVMLIDGGTQIKIVDFGIAKILPDSQRELQKLTQTGQLFGTAFYMSPEQCRAENLNDRSDIYSLGCLMYEVLDGTTPLAGSSPYAVVMRQILEDPKDSAFVESSRFGKLVLSCLSKDAQARPSGATVREALNDPCRFIPSSKTRTGPIGRNNLITIGTASILGIVSAIVLFARLSTSIPEPRANFNQEHLDRLMTLADESRNHKDTQGVQPCIDLVNYLEPVKEIKRQYYIDALDGLAAQALAIGSFEKAIEAAEQCRSFCKLKNGAKNEKQIYLSVTLHEAHSFGKRSQLITASVEQRRADQKRALVLLNEIISLAEINDSYMQGTVRRAQAYKRQVLADSI